MFEETILYYNRLSLFQGILKMQYLVLCSFVKLGNVMFLNSCLTLISGLDGL